MKYPKLDFGTVEAVINKLGGMEGMQAFLRGESELVMNKHLIDCDEDPVVNVGWEVVEHKKDGQFALNPKKVKLYLSKNQQNGKVIEGHKLRKELADQPVLNANVLDYLLAHPYLIPEKWKGRKVFFWGTIFSDPGGSLRVRYLSWYSGRWGWLYSWLGEDWHGRDHAAMRAK